MKAAQFIRFRYEYLYLSIEIFFSTRCFTSSLKLSTVSIKGMSTDLAKRCMDACDNMTQQNMQNWCNNSAKPAAKK